MHVMANVRSRAKSPPKAAKQRIVRKRKKTSDPTDEPEKMVESKKSKLKRVLKSDEKVAILLQSGLELKEKFMKKIPYLDDGKINKDALSIVKQQLISKSGRIKKKSRDSLSLFDNILKRELKIEETSPKKIKSKSPPAFHVMDNNNYDGISDQNKSESDQSIVNSPKKDKKSKIKKRKETKLKQTQNKVQKKDKLKQKSGDDSANRLKTKQVTLSNGVVLTLSLFQCDYCLKTFSNKSSLRRHIYMHLDLKPYKCSHCSKRFRQRSNLQVHILRKHIKDCNQTYLCNQCDKPFLLRENLILHLSSHVKSENRDSNSFKCVFCDKKFSHHLLLSQHEKQHLVSGRFQCSICCMSYDCRSRLSLHVKSHLNIKEYVCQYCGKEFLRPNSIRRHVEICHGGHRIQCPICKKKLKGHLTEHLRTHENKRPHACPECGQRFTQSTQLTVHRRSHTGVRPYPCRICDRPFSHSNALMLHIRRHTGEKPFQCAMCPMAFSQLPHMKAHMSKIHGKAEAYKCTKCFQFFKLKVQLEGHMKMCTFGERELTFDEKIQASIQSSEEEVESVMSLSRMRFLLALLITMIATKDKLKYLGFNKRLIDDLLVESLEAMGKEPCKDKTLNPLKRLKVNIQSLLNGLVPEDQMEKFRQENKSTEELLVLLTDEKKML